MSTSSQSRLFRFGVFEIDLQQGELRRAGLRQKLGPQPFQVLQTLLERPGELVTREELRQRLWPDQTFVDYELALKKCINRIREVLGDSADSPRFVETVPRRGYRFIAPVQQIHQSDSRNGTSATVYPDPPLAPAQVAEISRHAEHVPSRPPEIVRSKRTIHARSVVAGLAIFMTLLALIFVYLAMRPEAAPKASNYAQLTNDGQPKKLIGTDGSRLYLYLTGADYHGMAEMPTTGGELKKLPILPPEFVPVNLSPDGTEILAIERLDFTGAGPLWTVPVVAGTPRRLGSLVAQDATFSPDGMQLAYCYKNELFVSKADGTQSRKLIQQQDRLIYDIVWSPDNTSLRFHVQDNVDTLPTLWEVSLDGTGMHRLFPDWDDRGEWQWGGVWTSDGKYFLFWCARHIWALPRERRFLQGEPKPIELTSSPLGLSPPLPSRDGKKLFLTGGQRRGQLVRYDPTSAQFVSFMSGISAEQLAFSGDGQWVAYVSYPEGTLWRSRADGTDKVQLTFPPAYSQHSSYVLGPSWSPDGRRIVFFDDAASNTSKIYEVSTEGGSPQVLMPNDPNPQTSPNWSPDGNKILFSGRSNDLASSIRILDLTTREISTVPGSQGLFAPRWSPDGQYIAALTTNGTQLQLFDFHKQKWTEVANGQTVGWMGFSRTGQYLEFFDGTGDGTVLKYGLKEHKTERIIDLKKFPTTGYYGSWLGMAPDDSPLILRDAATQDVYSLDWEEP